MHATQRLLFKSFWGRSLDEFKRLSNIVIKSEGIKGPSGPRELHAFREPTSVQDCKVLSDDEIGGFSTVHLDWVSPSSSSDPQHQQKQQPPHRPTGPSSFRDGDAYARFHGTISTELPRDRPRVQRSGYAGFRTADRPPTLFGRSLWDIDPYVYLALRVRSDGRAYFVNVQTEGVVPTDLHQHRLFVKRPGEWETVLIKWNDFVRTNHGFVVEPQTEILRQKIRSVGIGLTDRTPGPFELCIQGMWATNDWADADAAATYREGELKDRHGQRITWGNQ